jgi:IgGFc binding protein/Putative metal-binding motif
MEMHRTYHSFRQAAVGNLTFLLAFALLSACGPNNTTDDTDAGPPDSALGMDVTVVDADLTQLTDDDGDGFSEAEGDCDDTDHLVHPDAVEICSDEVDNNCNGATDANEPDEDGDGYGPCNGDCNDDDSAISPSATEIMDGIDNNCDGIIDADFDGDGYRAADGDCDDDDPAVHPGAVEICFDGLDNDCDGDTDADQSDADGDGVGPCGGDCDDANDLIGPHMDEIPGDGIDNNCDNLVDLDIDGDGWTVQNGDCDDDDPDRHPSAIEDCDDGVDNNCNNVIDTDCLTPCELAEIARSSVGCVYFAVDTDNANAQHDAMPYAVAVSNTHATDSAFVEVQTRSGGVWSTIQSATVAPFDLNLFTLPDRHIDLTGYNLAGAYRVVSDLPVIAYQFQPVDGINSVSSDAALLLPQSSLDQYYYVVGWSADNPYPPEVVIVAAHDNTSITITPSVTTTAGGGIPALTAGVAYTFPQTFSAGDYIQLASNGSFSGTYVEADYPVAVFSAHCADNVPVACCADHMEEQMFGLQTWGQTYVAARMPVRSTGTPEACYWHILASVDNTVVSFSANSAVTGLPGSPVTLQAGEELELVVSGTMANPGDFVITATDPIGVMSFLSSSSQTNVGAAQSGDPAMSQMVPVEQFLDSYVVLVPPNWIYDRVILIKPVGATVTLDGAPVAQGQFISIDDGVTPVEWEVARLSVTDGVHRLNADAPFGIVVVGFDSYDSYAYPGGLDQKIINPIL